MCTKGIPSGEVPPGAPLAFVLAVSHHSGCSKQDRPAGNHRRNSSASQGTDWKFALTSQQSILGASVLQTTHVQTGGLAPMSLLHVQWQPIKIYIPVAQACSPALSAW